jgi:EmrB/QacA subfamily drug resistance transporter
MHEDIRTERTHREIMVVMGGLIIAMLLAQLDNMIVAPAMPTIVGDLGGLKHLAWVVTAYILGTTIATPLWGKFGDLFGRKPVFITSICVFLVGSALCGLSQNMDELIGFRGLQGVGAGGLMVGVMAIIAEVIPPRERGRYMGYMFAVMPLSMVGGPLLGGLFTDQLSWRWAFYVNIPLGIIALTVISRTMDLKTRTTGARVDWPGAALLTVWTSSLVLLASWGGSQYAWGSPQIIGLGALAVVGLVVFAFVEHRTKDAILPLDVFRNRNFSVATALSFSVGFGMFGAMVFIPQYQQFVQGDSATSSGLLLLPLMVGVIIMAVISGKVISRTGKYRSLPITGTALMAIGLALLATLGVDSGRVLMSLYLVVLGAGMGCLMQTTMLIAQNSVEMKDIGAATGASTFTRSMGGSLGVAILGAFYTSHIVSSLSSQLGSSGKGLIATGTQLTPRMLNGLPEASRHAFQVAITSGIHVVFIGGASIGAIAFVLSWAVRNVPLRGSAAPAAEPAQPKTEDSPALEAAFAD